MQNGFEALLGCGVLAHGFARLPSDDRSGHKFVAFSGKRRGSCASCGARRVAQAAAHMVEHVIPLVPVRQPAQS